jgi:hypothetical protein
MPHTVEVDISAKVEQWSKDTAVAFSDGISGSILIKKKVKKAARDWLHERYPNRGPAFYTHLLLATLTYITIKPYLPEIQQLRLTMIIPGSPVTTELKTCFSTFYKLITHRYEEVLLALGRFAVPPLIF